MRVLPSGVDAFILEFGDNAEALAYLAGLRSHPVDGVVEIVPAARTLLLRTTGAASMPDVVRAIKDIAPGPLAATADYEIQIATVYDGEDLTVAADHLGLSVEALVARHSTLTWTVAFCGFAPGFAYMTCDDDTWMVPRRSSPRTRVPAGSVALAGGYTGCYPTSSPGGWQLIGRTDASLWDTGRSSPALLTPGTRVSFVDVTGRAPGQEGVRDAETEGAGR
ncbi:5-oxoprolinase subunit B family protein [Austwickia chelonae]|uniref:5-oxoprolinase subunit B family protein n=1 Tax=Austwickia chelonae TaxID=100225 RepID=UPI000E281DD0|nr:allophanate hydrolase subunit 1 [Austwickia chelonae]